jgi:hypothetical protein
MCTVTFIPTQNGFLLTSNRDERLARPSLPPMKYMVFDQVVFFPKELQSQGTWIATSENLFTLCLLNGAFQGHTPNPPYRKSRGLVLLDFFQFNHVDRFAYEYDFEGIEPFTLILVDCNATRTLHSLVWDGVEIHLKEHNPELSHIWSSSTLYDLEMRSKREVWFEKFLADNPVVSLNEALYFHHFGGDGGNIDSLVMQRQAVQTISITAVEADELGKRIVYEDLVDKKIHRCLVY